MENCRIRVVLDHKQDIFRDIIVTRENTFQEIYETIIKAFDFSGQELASFYTSNENWDQGREIAMMDMGFAEEPEMQQQEVLTMSGTRVEDLLKGRGDRMILVYDFMRMWCFYLEVVELNEELTEKTPFIAYSFGNAPAEDSRVEPGLPDDDEDDHQDIESEIDDMMNDFGIDEDDL